MLVEDVEDFLVFEVEDTGERKRIEDVTPQMLQSILHSKQVLVILRKDLNRIYIWKGSASPVKKRFISSRVAMDIRENLHKSCKIVSIDQGDELQEFLDTFGLDSMPVSEVLEDMRYVRNSEKRGFHPAEAKILMSKIKTIKKETPIVPSKAKIEKLIPKISLSEDNKQNIIELLNTINEKIQKIIEILKGS